MNIYQLFNTEKKYKFARLIYHILHNARALLKINDIVTVKRKNIKYKLDLSEGIDLGIYLGLFENSTYNALKRLTHKGSCVFDIGANIGAFTFFLASLVGKSGKVYAFEPTNFAFNKLKANLELNESLTNIISLFNAYLDDERNRDEQKKFYSSWSLKNTVEQQHLYHYGLLQEAPNAYSITLDEIVEREKISLIDVIKIDVDGHESKVLRGGYKSIQKFKPAMISEICPYALKEHGSSLEELLGIYKELGYQIYDESTFKKIPMESKVIEKMIPFKGGINVCVLFCEDK